MNIVDELGSVQAAIAELREEERKLKGQILDRYNAGMPIEGDLFKAAVIEQDRVTPNWRKIAEIMQAPAVLVDELSTHKTVISIKVTARPTDARRAA